MNINNFVLVICIVFLSGCSTVSGESKITINHYDTYDVVTIESNKKEQITFEVGDSKVVYSSMDDSILKRMLGAVSLGVVGAKK